MYFSRCSAALLLFGALCIAGAATANNEIAALRGSASARQLQDEVNGVLNIVVNVAGGFGTSGPQVVVENLDEDWEAFVNGTTDDHGNQVTGSRKRSRELQSLVTQPVTSLNMTADASMDRLEAEILGGAVLVADYTMSFAITIADNDVNWWGFELALTFDNVGNDRVQAVGSAQHLRPRLNTDATGTPLPYDLAVEGGTTPFAENTPRCFEHIPEEGSDDEHRKDCIVKAELTILESAQVGPSTNIVEFKVHLIFEHKIIDPHLTGDPHFMTWNGDQFDYQGECDLVLIDNAAFDSGAGMDVHARTRLQRRGVGRDRWSRMDRVAIRLGPDVFEAHGSSMQYWINGKKNVPLPAMLGGYEIKEVAAPIPDVMKRYVIDLENGEKMWIKTFHEFVYFELEGSRVETYKGSRGVFGEYTTGQMIGRDGRTVISDPYDFGQEWQVRPHEDRVLFMKAEGVQYPDKCILPKKHVKGRVDTPELALRQQERHRNRHHRRLGTTVTDKQAREACDKVDHWTREECVFDVMATGDLTMAVAYM